MFCLSELNQVKSAYYADDKEKTTSIQRALKFYDKISISSDVKAEGIANPNGGLTLQISEEEKKTESGDRLRTVQELDVEDLNRIDIAKDLENKNSPDVMADKFRKTSLSAKVNEMQDSENKKDSSATGLNDIIAEHTVSYRKETSNLGSISPVMSFENRVFEESEWKQAPASKKSNSKKSPQYYDAYVEGKRPPLPNEVQNARKGKASLFLAFYSLYESWKTLFRERTGSKTTILVIMVLTSPLYVAPMVGK